MSKSDRLSCGGKGPCCHVGYSHRHCEHCDTVISLVPFTWPVLPNPWPYQPFRPFWNAGGTGTGSQIPPTPRVYAMHSGTASGTLYMQATKALEEHTCEVK